MDWLLSGVGTLHQPASSASSTAAANHGQAAPPTLPRPIPQLQGDPTFLYGGYGYRPPTFGYAWMNGANQPTSYCQLPTDNAPKALSKSVSAPDLQNTTELQKQVKQQQPAPRQQPHVKMQGTPPLPRHNKHLSVASAPPGTPGEQSAANTPSSSRANTPPRRSIGDGFYIGMAAA